MKVKNGRLIIIGENFNATRKIKATSPRVQRTDGKWYINYVDLDGSKCRLDVTATIPEDPNEQRLFPIPHIAEACRQRNMQYITWIIRAQEAAGAHVIDLCVDELSVYPEERWEWMKWIVQTVLILKKCSTIKPSWSFHISKPTKLPAMRFMRMSLGTSWTT